MTNEIWKDVVGYEGLYQFIWNIRNCKGRIRSAFDMAGYLSLYKNGHQNLKVHSYCAFINPELKSDSKSY